MDLREKKTLRSIKNAFLQLRKQKPLERITVKELTQLAEISKTTFYLHYNDIYDLSESLQNEVITDIVGSIPHPESFLTDNTEFTHELFNAFHSQECLIDILFSGNQAAILPLRIEQELMQFIGNMLPKADKSLAVLLTYHIQGSFNAYERYRRNYDNGKLIELIITSGKAINEAIENMRLGDYIPR